MSEESEAASDAHAGDGQDGLSQALTAAKERDAEGMMRALYACGYLGGLLRRLQAKYPSLPLADTEEAVALAADSLYDDVVGGTRVSSVGGLLYRIADRRALDALREHRGTLELLEGSAAAEGEDPAQLEHDRQARELLRISAIRTARSLLPTLGGEKVQRVMTVVLDALESGLIDVTNEEIADATGLSQASVRLLKKRGFDRLAKRAQDAGLVALESDFIAEPSDDETSS